MLQSLTAALRSARTRQTEQVQVKLQIPLSLLFGPCCELCTQKSTQKWRASTLAEVHLGCS